MTIGVGIIPPCATDIFRMLELQDFADPGEFNSFFRHGLLEIVDLHDAETIGRDGNLRPVFRAKRFLPGGPVRRPLSWEESAFDKARRAG